MKYTKIYKEATFEVIGQPRDKYSNRAYMHKADYTSQIKPLLEWWSGYLDKIKHR